MCKECEENKVPVNGDKMHYELFDELTDDLKEKFQSEAKGMNLDRAKKGYVAFINKLNENGDTLVGNYINNNTNVVIKYKKCGHIPQKGISPHNYKNGHGCLCIKQSEDFRKLQSKKMSELVNKWWQSEEYKSQQTKRMSGENNSNWQGGITTIASHLRNFTKRWERDVRKAYNKKCALTGVKCTTRNSTVHHLYGFNMIVLDAHTTHNIEVKSQVKDYTKEELQLLEDYVLECHKDTNNGVLLHNDAHKLFHRSKDNGGYGYGDNTPEQFEEFKERYLNGEFDSKTEDVA